MIRYNEGAQGGAYVLANYKYVPGLKEDDPSDLILMYLDRPTSPDYSRKSLLKAI
jgi:hypothetical protein